MMSLEVCDGEVDGIALPKPSEGFELEQAVIISTYNPRKMISVFMIGVYVVDCLQLLYKSNYKYVGLVHSTASSV